jgi:hypothetical protein
LITNAILAIWLWVSAGDIHSWIVQTPLWRMTHLAFLLFSAVAIYFAMLWLTGVRLQHLLMPSKPVS